MRILLVALNAKYVHTNISLRTMSRMTAHLPVTTRLLERTVNEPLDRILEDILTDPPDLLAFSVYIWNVEAVGRLTALVQAVRPGLPILYGGPEVSFDTPAQLAALGGDYIIRGEGEKTYAAFIGSLLMEGPLEEVAGLTFRTAQGIVENPPRAKMDLQEVPFPYGPGEDLRGKIAYMEASRGCPYRCIYCLSAAERDLRFLPGALVKDRVLQLLAQGATLVKFTDRTFNIHPDLLDILSFLLALDTDTTFHFEVAPDLVREEQVALLRAAPPGRFQFEAGVQSTDGDVLAAIHRRLPFASIRDKLRLLADLPKVHSHMDLIAGLPYADMAKFQRSFNDVYALQPNMLQLGFLKVIKGTPLAGQVAQFGIVHSPDPPYEVLKTRWMSYGELRRLKALEEVLERYYNSGRFPTALSVALSCVEDPFAFYMALGEAFKGRGYFQHAPGVKEVLSLLQDFVPPYRRTLGLDTEAVLWNEALKMDWLDGNKKQYVPEGLTRSYLPDNTLRNRIIRRYGKNIHVERFEVDILRYMAEGTVEVAPHHVVWLESEGRKVPLEELNL